MNLRKLNKIVFVNEEKTTNVMGKEGSSINQIEVRFEKVWFYLTLLLTALLIIFSLSIVWVQTENAKAEKNYQRELQIKEIQNTLSNAVIASNRNEYELSRQTITDFFGLLEKELALGNNSVFNPDQREIIKGILDKKAIVNQSLADKNPQANTELEKILENYRKAVRGFQPLKGRIK